MTLCLDANVVVDVLRRREAVTMCWQAAVSGAAPMVISTLVLHELEAGVALSARPDIHAARLRQILTPAEVIEFEADDAAVAGRLRAELQREGRPIGPIDTLIAGQALARRWTVVTHNIRHFGRVRGLSLMDWTEGPDLLAAARIAARMSGES